MALINKLRSLFKRIFLPEEKEMLSATTAYDEWAETYDVQLKNGNITVFYNDLVVDELLGRIPIKGRTVCDFGAGTGRYHDTMAKYKPERWIGCDVSQGMLDRLMKKIPDAEVYKLDDHQLYFLKDQEVDVLFSSLTLGYIKNIEDVFEEWNRVLRPGGYIVLSMFHPEFGNLEKARSFTNARGKVRIILSHQHRKDELLRLFKQKHWQIHSVKEAGIDERAIPELDRMGKSDMYKGLAGKPLIIGFVLRKE